MISILLGDSGHGKSTFILDMLREDAKNHTRSLLIVPEQQTVDSEKAIATLLPPSAQLYCEAINFTRLANKVFREHGGLRYNYVTKSGRSLLMYQAICECRDSFTEYKIKKGRESGYVKMFLDVIGELKTYSVSTESIENAIQGLENQHLASRLTDVLLVWRVYESLLSESFSDSYDDMLLLEKKLSEIDYFKDANVYIDSFYSFTKSQLNIIYHIINQAKNVTIALDCPKDAEKSSMQYAKIAASKDKLLSMCKRLKKDFTIVPFDTDYKHKSEEIKYLSQNVWTFNAPSIDKSDKVTLALAGDEFEECEYVASQIKKLILNGERYSSIAVIMRNSDTYRGIIDYAFDKYEIPYFFSSSVDIMSMPLIKMIFSALNAISAYRAEDVISYIKCGYTDITEDELAELESYLFRWNIYGKKFLNDDYFASNPDGYTQGFSESQAKRLSLVLDARKKVLDKLSILENAFIKKQTVLGCANAVFEFLEAHSVRAQIEKEIDSAISRKDAYELSQIWNILLKSLDNLAHICGEIQASSEDFTTLLRYSLDGNKLGSIPVGEDTVIIGDAPTIRTNGIKHAFVLGVNEGVFPAEIAEDRFFSDTDKITLETVGIDLSSKSDERADDELLYFKNAISCPSDTLTVSCLKTNLKGKALQPSIAFIRLNSLLGENYKPVDASFIPAIDKIYTKSVAAEYLSHENTPVGIASSELLCTTVKSADFSNENARVDSAPELLGSFISLSKSSIESFAYCKFKYYCSYVLRLKSSKKISFASNDVGTLNHLVIEKFFALARDEKIDASALSDEDIEKIVDDIIKSYALSVCGSSSTSNKLTYLFNKLKKSLIIYLKDLISEFGQSEFKPEYFELSLIGDGKSAPVSLKFKVGENATISLNGTVDRVDIFRKDNKTYVRIVDYKSGSEKISLEHLSRGFGMQLFIYLFTICKLRDCEFRSKLLSGTEEIIPAGLAYFPMNMDKRKIESDIDLESSELDQLEKQTVKDKIQRSGFFLDDIEIIKAQDRELSGRFASTKKGDLLTPEAFDSIYEQIEATINEIGTQLLSGDASAIPVKLGQKSPCTYCEHMPICRSRRRV